MRLGFILECAQDGPDQKVFEYLARKLFNDIEVESETLGNKGNLIDDAGKAAEELLNAGCEHVCIIWDVQPRWTKKGEPKEPKPYCVIDCNNIKAALAKSAVDSPNVHLICFETEFESLLLHDHIAISAVITRLSNRTVAIRPPKPSKVRNPKEWLEKLFDDNKVRTYTASTDAIRIIMAADIEKLKKCPAVARMIQKING